MDEPELPPCGLYRTAEPIGDIPAGRLVYYHNHGDPGPGVYLPAGWAGNRARFHRRGTTVSPRVARALIPLPAEGFYRVAEPFHCCDARCRLFEVDELVQLGYDGEATAILFTPEIVDGQIVVPERGIRVDGERLQRLRFLKIAVSDRGEEPTH